MIQWYSVAGLATVISSNNIDSHKIVSEMSCVSSSCTRRGNAILM